MAAGLRMRTVFKYPLEATVNDIEVPIDYKPLCVHEQDGAIMLWAEVESPSRNIGKARVHVVGTGSEVPRGSQYVGTAFIAGFVWHVYAYRPRL
jgi:hypothetical protein